MIGTTVSHYRILEKLGEGGMGVVYKAHDTNLDRDVALKFLPPQVAASSDDKSRFLHEARALAHLAHPNICTIHSVEEEAGKAFIVMEYVEGKTLRNLYRNIPLKQAVDIGIQIADGLAAAHEKGIVHRDIKPDNMMIGKDGRVQIMDFGLAKLKGGSRITKEGSTVGTVGYMSPEQVRGQETDHRTDIFSLGVVLYELLAGQSPFKGVHETAIAYEIVNVDPAPPSAVKPDLDPRLDAIVLECLEKDPSERYQSAPEVSKELRRFKRESSRTRASRLAGARAASSSSQMESSARETEADQPESGLRRILPVLLKRNPWVFVSFVLVVVSVVLGYLHFQSLPQLQTVTRSYILPPGGMAFNSELGGHLAISPNGQILAFVAKDPAGKNQLWIRALNSLSSLPLAGTGGAEYPFWSPESKSIGFFALGKLKRVDASGGPVTTICEAADGRGGSWNRAGTIIFAPTAGSQLHQVAATGGISSTFMKSDTVNPFPSNRWPFFLPDGKHFLYTAPTTGTDNWAIYASLLGDTSQKRILNVKSKAEFTDGFMMYFRENNLIAHPFDPGTLEFIGDPIPVAENIVFDQNKSRSDFSFSQNGVLVYLSGSSRPSGPFMVDRNGKLLSQLKTGAVSIMATFSPDGKRIVLDSHDPARSNYDIWTYDIARGLNTRFTFDAGEDEVPVFSPDGNKVIFSSNRRKSPDLFIKDFGGISKEEFLYGSPLDDYPTSWSPDGKSLLLSVRGDPKTKWDVVLLPLTGDRKPVPLAQTEFNEQWGTFSPDSRWVAYVSDESGRNEIYVRTLDSRGGKWQVSNSGGDRAYWLRKSNEIIYTTPARKVVAATVKYSSSSFEVVRTTPLFDLNIQGVGTLHDVTADGQTFLVQFAGTEGTSSPATLVLNWQEELKQKMEKKK